MSEERYRVSKTFANDFKIILGKEKIPECVRSRMQKAAKEHGLNAAKKELLEYWGEFIESLNAYEEPGELEIARSEGLSIKYEFLKAELDKEEEE